MSDNINTALSIPNNIVAPEILKPPASTGRPLEYNKDIAQAILNDIATTTDTIGKITMQHNVARATFFNWTLQNQQFLDAYVRACENRALLDVDNVEDTLEALMNYINTSTDDARDKHVKIQAMRLKIEQIRWKASKHNRRVYGDKVEQTIDVTAHIDGREQAWRELQAMATNATYTPIIDTNNVDNPST